MSRVPPPPILPPPRSWMQRWSGKKSPLLLTSDIADEPPKPRLRPLSAPLCARVIPTEVPQRPRSAASHSTQRQAPPSSRLQAGNRRKEDEKPDILQHRKHMVQAKAAKARMNERHNALMQQFAHSCNLHRKLQGHIQCGRCELADLKYFERHASTITRASSDHCSSDGTLATVSRQYSKATTMSMRSRQNKKTVKEKAEQLDDDVERRLACAAASYLACTERYVLLALRRLQQPLLHQFVDEVDFAELCRTLGFKSTLASYAGRPVDASSASLSSTLRTILPISSFSACDIQTICDMFTNSPDGVVWMSDVSSTFTACVNRHHAESWLQYFYTAQLISMSLLNGSEPSLSLLQLQTLLCAATAATSAEVKVLQLLQRHLHGPCWKNTATLPLSFWYQWLSDEDPELAKAFEPNWSLPFIPCNPWSVRAP